MSFSPVKSIARGRWQPSGGVVTMTMDDDLPANHHGWEVGQLVEVQPRTWAGINRIGGHGKITKVHVNTTGVVESLDVQYTINGGYDSCLDPDLVKPYQELSRRGRSRRTRDVYAPPQLTDKENEVKPKQRSKSLPAARVRSSSKPRKSVDKTKKETRLPKNVQKTVNTKVAMRKKIAPIALKEWHFDEACSIDDGIPREIVVPRQRKDKDSSKNYTFKVSPLAKIDTKNQSRKRSSPAASLGVFDEVSAPRDSESFSAAAHAAGSVSPHTKTRAKRLATGHLSGSETNLTNQSTTTSPSGNAYAIPQQPRVHLTLEQVYNDQKREATSFINNVVAGRQEESEERQLDLLPSPPTDERQNAFQLLLNELLTFNEMAMDEDIVMDQVNQRSKQRRQDGIQFSPEETEKFIQNLAGEDKIMRSGGMIISI